MTDRDRDASAEAEIRALIDERVEAIQRKDVETLVNAVAPDIVLFDALDSLQRRGSTDVRAKTTQWLGWYEGPLGFEVRDLTVEAGGDLAFCAYLYRVTGTMTNGDAVDMWVRSTLGLRKIDGVWKVVHEHASVPFNAENGKALVALKP